MQINLGGRMGNKSLCSAGIPQKNNLTDNMSKFYKQITLDKSETNATVFH